MLRYNSLIAALFLCLGVAKFSSACFAAPQPDVWTKCSEELGLNKFYFSSNTDLDYNRTCIKKCIYEKEGKLDADGNFVLPKFGNDKSEAATECVQKIKLTDICRKVDAVDDCVFQKTDQYLKRYSSCEQYKRYNEDPKEPLYTPDDCHTRCQLIIDGTLEEDGKLNTTIYSESINKNITLKEALETCEAIVKNDVACSHDVNMNYCVSFIVNHWSSEQLKNELECSKETNVYPFFGSQFFNNSRICYDHCLLLKNGDLDASDVTKSAYFKRMNATEETINKCKHTDANLDKCTSDIYTYDCVNYIQYANPDYLQKQIECAKETNSYLVSLRNQGAFDNSCQTRCIMIKEGKFDENGNINRTELKQFTINEDVITESIDECKPKNANSTCQEDVDAYHCAVGTINMKVNRLCEEENKNTNSSPISVGYNMCYSRCLMVHQGQIDSDGTININSFKYLNKDESLLKMAVASCKDKTHEEDPCAQVVNTYNCVSLEVWNIENKQSNNLANSISNE